VPMLRKALSLRREMGEPGNALAAQSWLGLALSETGEPLQARPLLEAALSQIAAEGYGGDYPEQEVWWAAYCVLAAAGESARARGCLEQAHRLVEAQAGRAQSASLRQAFLEGVPVNRMIERAWQKAAEET